MELTQKKISEIIHTASLQWDIEPMSKQFAIEVAKEIIKAENEQIKENLTKHNKESNIIPLPKGRGF